MQRAKPIVVRLMTAVIFASVIGGLFLGNNWHRRVELVGAQASRVTPASVEMMRLLRDEHDLVADMVEAQLALSGSSFDPTPIAAAERAQAIAMR